MPKKTTEIFIQGAARIQCNKRTHTATDSTRSFTLEETCQRSYNITRSSSYFTHPTNSSSVVRAASSSEKISPLQVQISPAADQTLFTANSERRLLIAIWMNLHLSLCTNFSTFFCCIMVQLQQLNQQKK